MPFVTTLSLQSGDRTALESVVEDIRETARRKGVEIKGPHTHPAETCEATLYSDLAGRRPIGAWEYSVYERTVRIIGHEETAREIAGWELPDSVRVEVDIEQVNSVGSR